MCHRPPEVCVDRGAIAARTACDLLGRSDYVKEIFVDAGAPRQLIRRNHYSLRFIPLPMAFNDEVGL